MSDWTDSARRTLDDYCARAKAVLEGTDADANEVIEDLRRHVEEEVRAAGLGVVTEDDVRRILARVGEPGANLEPGNGRGPSVPAPAAESWYERKPRVLLFLFGVLLPVVTLVFEWVTGASAGVLFDPMPSWFHTLAIVLVPAANLWLWLAGRARDSRHATLLGWLNGAALGISIYYAILYLPFSWIAAMGVLYFGLGLIPLAPYFLLVAIPLLRNIYCRRIGKDRLPGAWKGALLSLGILILLQVPTAVTYYGLDKASSEETEDRLHGIRVLRLFGDDELMLRACYGLLRQRELDVDLVRAVASGGRIVSADQAREAYYRVTGKPFNSVPPPSMYTRSGRWTARDEEFTWDEALGGEEVAGRVKGLSLLSSRMDAVAEPMASLVYCEWTLEFKNVSSQTREARAQIALPPGAVVSRVTLWINGEEREAAFGGRGEVRQAYQQVAVVQRRDPVLVTTCGPDRVLMQCFPVPARGGVMKVRVGITAPLTLESTDQGRFIWPRFLERNFRIAEDFQHALWIESPTALGSGKPTATSTRSNAHPFTVRESLRDTNLTVSSRAVDVRRPAEAATVWTPTEDAGQIIRQITRPVAPVLPPRVVLVLDGSEGMNRFVPEISDALSKFPETTEIAVIVAGDELLQLAPEPRKATQAFVVDLQRNLGHARFVGGQDNLPALVTAWDYAAAVDGGIVVWIHLPQPVLLSPESALQQRLERSSSATRLLELQVRNGPDRVAEKLDGLWAVEHVTHLDSVRSDFERLLNEWTGKTQRFELVREKTAASSDATIGARVSKHLERLWARDETLRLAARRKRDEATRVAAAHQLVTPVTGAVVLETKEQYDRFNLKPADPTTVPAIPEPQLPALVGVGIGVWVLLRWRRKRTA